MAFRNDKTVVKQIITSKLFRDVFISSKLLLVFLRYLFNCDKWKVTCGCAVGNENYLFIYLVRFEHVLQLRSAKDGTVG